MKRVRIAAALIALALSACGNHAAIERARKLPPERLARLAEDLRQLEHDTPPRRYIGSDIPAAFADLQPSAVVVKQGYTGVHLAGAMDDKVIIALSGSNGTPRLMLWPGEAEPRLELWPSREME